MFALLKGFVLGMSAYMIGMLMDFTISIRSMREILSNTPELFARAVDKIQMNLLVISPVIYALTDTYLLDKTTTSFDLDELEKKLHTAIENEDYELAAKIRDQIKKINE